MQKETWKDIKLPKWISNEIFDGECMHNNDGTHSDGGIADDLI